VVHDASSAMPATRSWWGSVLQEALIVPLPPMRSLGSA
jgi:hypothetical protein